MDNQALSSWLVGAATVLLAVLGLFLASRAVDPAMTIFGFGLLVFGVLFIFKLIGRAFDGAEAPRERDNA